MKKKNEIRNQHPRLKFHMDAYCFLMLHLLPLQAFVLKLPYQSYVNEQHSSRKKGRLAEGRRARKEERRKREEKRKKEFIGLLDLNIYFHRNTKICLMLTFLMEVSTVSPSSPCELTAAIM